MAQKDPLGSRCQLVLEATFWVLLNVLLEVPTADHCVGTGKLAVDGSMLHQDLIADTRGAAVDSQDHVAAHRD